MEGKAWHALWKLITRGWRFMCWLTRMNGTFCISLMLVDGISGLTRTMVGRLFLFVRMKRFSLMIWGLESGPWLQKLSRGISGYESFPYKMSLLPLREVKTLDVQRELSKRKKSGEKGVIEALWSQEETYLKTSFIASTCDSCIHFLCSARVIFYDHCQLHPPHFVFFLFWVLRTCNYV